MSSKINLQTCEYARKSSIFQDNQLIYTDMYSINVTSYRVAEDDELGLEGKMPTVEIVSK